MNKIRRRVAAGERAHGGCPGRVRPQCPSDAAGSIEVGQHAVDQRTGRKPARFIGWSRSGPFIWFTTCQARVADPGVEFAFDVTTFGFPVARWGYRFSPAEGGTEVTEYWVDKRDRGATVLGRIFTGKSSTMRPEVNREGMRETLRRLKSELESEPKS